MLCCCTEYYPGYEYIRAVVGSDMAIPECSSDNLYIPCHSLQEQVAASRCPKSLRSAWLTPIFTVDAVGLTAHILRARCSIHFYVDRGASVYVGTRSTYLVYFQRSHRKFAASQLLFVGAFVFEQATFHIIPVPNNGTTTTTTTTVLLLLLLLLLYYYYYYYYYYCYCYCYCYCYYYYYYYYYYCYYYCYYLYYYPTPSRNSVVFLVI